MPVTSAAQANSKTAEFARLFDLFDRVATRRARALTGNVSTSQVISADDLANVPAEFAPVLQNLSTILSLRTLRDEEPGRRVQVALKTTATSARCLGIPETIASIASEPATPTTTADDLEPSADDAEEKPESPRFPLEERYPFTFKLMLHTLYDLDEWAEKVKHAVEASKSQFKPLAERVQNVVRDTAANIQERGEKRSSSVRPAFGASAKSKSPLGATRHPQSIAMPEKPEISRVVKKRCVGRRKSISGPVSTGVWVYDAAVSATEIVPGPRSVIDTALSRPRDAGDVVENRVRHRSLTALEETRTRDAARRKINNPVPLPEKDISQSVPLQPSPVQSAKPAQQIVETGTKNVLKKRSSVASVVFASTQPRKRATVKGPLCL